MSSASDEPALETRALCKSFGALRVADSIDFRLERGARHALIGPNGAGKTSFINLVTGALRPSAGQILLDGEDVTSLSRAARVKRGIGRTFQINTLFNGLTVLENMLLFVPDHAALWREAALLNAHLGNYRAAIAALEEYLRRVDDAAARHQAAALLQQFKSKLN